MKEVMIRHTRTLNDAGTLRIFLIICASCGKQRDENGSWKHFEGHSADHSEATLLSHGICPPCARALYPDYYKG